jgi:hypothetical protein
MLQRKHASDKRSLKTATSLRPSHMDFVRSNPIRRDHPIFTRGIVIGEQRSRGDHRPTNDGEDENTPNLMQGAIDANEAAILTFAQRTGEEEQR